MSPATVKPGPPSSGGRGDLQAVHGGLLMALFALPLLLPQLRGWPAYLAVPLAVYALVVCAIAPLRRSVHWLRVGSLDRGTCAASVVIVVLSSSALVLWYVLFRPDVRDLAEQMVPAWPPAWLVLAGLGFAIVNALLEEVVWRGVMLDAWAAQLGRTGAVVAQALAFGVIHAQGIPRGVIGVTMASIYGLMLGALRLRAQGLAAPVLAHVCADATVFALLVMSAS